MLLINIYIYILRELTYPTKPEKENHRLKSDSHHGDITFLGIPIGLHLPPLLGGGLYMYIYIFIFIKGSLDEKLPSYEVLKMLRE